ncbi:MAG: 2-C-methyl-D-erythritol 2,4-cyclodiphosphate synthase [Dehalococcoidia bacterium]|nr:MAG: 2-C-methyl-D-erythritol 2,4-cyclodiphosphate synthase [Dehalococcoidia bacterium]
MTSLKVGSGFDIHRLGAGHRLVLGGVEVPFEMGLVSATDGDVLSHAIIDALFGAAALGNIGGHFPPGDPEFKGISSLELLKRTGAILSQNRWQIVNIDATVIAEKPKMMPYLAQMGEKLAGTLGIEPGRVNVKAKTSDGLGIIGRREAIAALATVLIEQK